MKIPPKNSLEQRTRPVVARCRAGEFLKAGVQKVVDVTCGLGADSVAFLEAGVSVDGYEIDPLVAGFAESNFAEVMRGLAGKIDNEGGGQDGIRNAVEGRVFNKDGLTADLTGVDAIFADPMRRDGGGSRKWKIEDYTPSLTDIVEMFLRARETGCRSLVCKLGPSVDRNLPDVLGLTARGIPARMVWVAVNNSVVEATLLVGDIAGERLEKSAVILHTDANGEEIGRWELWEDLVQESDEKVNKTSQNLLQQMQENMLGNSDDADVAVGNRSAITNPVLIEPCGAIIRAGLVQEFASKTSTQFLDPMIAYLISDNFNDTSKSLDFPPSFTFQAFEVLDTISMRSAKIREYLRDNNINMVEIKKRGVDIIPEDLRKKLKVKRAKGEPANEVTLFLTRVHNTHVCIVAKRINEV